MSKRRTSPSYAFDCTEDAVITGYRGRYAEVTIPQRARHIAAGAFQNRKGIRKLILNESVRTIGANAFRDCSNLEEIEAPEDCPLVEVGEDAFAGTLWLERQGECPILSGVPLKRPRLHNGELVLSEEVLVIPTGLFRGCVALTAVHLPQSLEVIGPEAFADCVHLERVEGDCPLCEVGKDAFAGTPWLHRQGEYPILNGVLLERPSFVQGELVIPDGVQVIPVEMFRGCKAIRSISLPEGLEGIRSRAFQGCVALEKVVLPQSLREIGDEVFQGCTSLQEVTLPDHLEYVGEGTFDNCTALTRAVFAKGFHDTGARAFRNCTALEEVVIPEGVEALSDAAFMGCTGLRRVVLPRSLQDIGESAFEGCTALEEIALPPGLQTIFGNAFFHCTALRRISIPAGADLMESAFEGSGLEEVELHSVIRIPYRCFKDCASLKRVEVYGKLRTIWDDAFYNCTQLEMIQIPRGTEHIFEHAFYGCKSLREITLPSSLSHISDDAFANCTGLRHIAMQMSLLRAKIFRGCPRATIALEGRSLAGRQTRNGLILSRDGTAVVWCNRDGTGTVRVPKGVEVIMDYAFADCIRITQVDLPESVRWIEEAAFSGCTSLKTLVQPEKLETIGDEAFRDTAFTDLTIPAGVQSVGEKILQGCPIRTVTVLSNTSVFHGVLVDPEPPGFALAKGGWGSDVPLGSRISWVRGYFGQLQRGETISYLIDNVFRAYIQHTCEELWADPVCLRGMLQYHLLPAERVNEALDAAVGRGDADEAAEILEYQRTLQLEKEG